MSEQKEVHQQLTHDSAREPERASINPPTPGTSHEPGDGNSNESLEDRYRDRGGRTNVPKSARDKEA